jgi:hypothetical protein
MRHCRKEGGVHYNLGKHTYRLRCGELYTNLLVHNRTKNGPKPDPSCPLGCKDEHGFPRLDYWLHWYLCVPSGAKDLTTARHNATCRALDRGIAQGTLGRYLKYTNFGRTDDEPEERTVPTWMLPGDRTGLPDKPDFLIVKGWPKGTPPPPGPTKNPPERGHEVKLVLAELKYTDDAKMHIKHDDIMLKYAPLIERLQDAGWKVNPVTASIVIGHRSTALMDNHQAFETLGIKGKKAQQAIQNKLVDISIDYTRRIVNATRRVRAARSNKPPPPPPPNLAAP